MKTILITLMFFTLTVCSRAQTNLLLTNNVPLGHSGINFGLASYLIMATSTNDEETFQRQGSVLFADEKNCQVFHNSTTNKSMAVQLPKWVSFQMEIKTKSGIPVPKSPQGKAFFKEPKLPMQVSSTPYGGVINGLGDLPRLDSLFEFPSNGEYVLEARHWYLNLDGAKPNYVLSDPVRLKIIKRPAKTSDPATTNAPSNGR